MGMVSLAAMSISRPVREGLDGERLPLRVLAAFEDACDLVAPGGRVIALVSRKVGDGPLNVVVDAGRPLSLLAPTGSVGEIDAGRLATGELEVGLGCADWEPRPDWERLRASYPDIRRAVPGLLALACRLAPSPGLLLVLGSGRRAPRADSRVLDTVRAAVAHLPQGEIWTPEQVEQAAHHLAGLGWGLTPCGDDFLAGLLAWAWLAHSRPQEVGEAAVRAAAPRTTTLSAALLRAAALGEYDAAWHGLLAALTSGGAARLEAALRRVLAHGATSGADRLAGFIYPMVA